MTVSNMTLVKIAAIGGFITTSMGFALHIKLINDVKQTEYYKEALRILRTHKGAVQLLGEPMKDGSIDVADTDKNYTRDGRARYEISIRAPKQNATLYFWADKNGEWKVKRIELGLQNEPNKRLLIKSQ